MTVMIQENADFSHQLTACFGDLAEFERLIKEIAEIAGIDLAAFEIDHLAVRVNTVENAEKWKAMLLNENTVTAGFIPARNSAGTGECKTRPYAELLKESLVNGRPIALLTFHQPLHFCGQAVPVLELPFPKGKTYPVEGWEHIEMVVPMLPDETVEQWIARCDKHWHLSQNLQLKLKISEPFVEGERLPNPSIAISLADKSRQNHCTIKLHPYSIERICQEN